jgi:hypothetical protein
MQRTDTVKKALCNAFLLDRLGIGPYIVITSHKPKKGSSSAKMIELAKDVLFDVICISVDEDFERLKSYVHALPWRTRTTAKQAQLIVPPSAEPVAQQSLFNIGTLHSFSRSKTKKKDKGQEQKSVVSLL